MRPLAGTRVLDLTRLLPGPYCAWLLRGWGARTIKVEEPGRGDYLREILPIWFDHLNAGAESIVLNLKQPGGRAAFLRLVASADVVLESFRPGVLERLGLGYAQLREVNRRVVLVSLSGFGSASDRAGHDLTYLARSGLLSLMQELPPLQLADMTGGLTAAAGVLAALLGARATGEGSHVQASLVDALFCLGALPGAEAKAGAPPVREQMILGGALPCYNVYTTADGGRMALGALEAKFWHLFCADVDRPGWVDRQLDPDLRLEVAALFASRTLAAWSDLATRVDCCLEPVISVSAAVAGRASVHPLVFDGERGAQEGSVPERGAHTVKLLTEAGLNEQEILTLIDEAGE